MKPYVLGIGVALILLASVSVKASHETPTEVLVVNGDTAFNSWQSRNACIGSANYTCVNREAVHSHSISSINSYKLTSGTSLAEIYTLPSTTVSNVQTVSTAINIRLNIASPDTREIQVILFTVTGASYSVSMIDGFWNTGTNCQDTRHTVFWYQGLFTLWVSPQISHCGSGSGGTRITQSLITDFGILVATGSNGGTWLLSAVNLLVYGGPAPPEDDTTTFPTDMGISSIVNLIAPMFCIGIALTFFAFVFVLRYRYWRY